MTNRDHTESNNAEPQINTDDPFEESAFVTGTLEAANCTEESVDCTSSTVQSIDNTATADNALDELSTTMDSSERNPLVATCPVCDVEFETSDPNAVLEFFRRHHRHTGHDVVWTEWSFSFDLPTAGDVTSVLSALEDNYDQNGVPIGTLTAAMAEQGYAIGETLDTLYEIRMCGNIFEPRADHVRAV